MLDIVHCYHRCILLESTTPDSSELLHVSSASKQVTEMNTHSSNVSTSLARDPEDAHVSLLIVLDEFALVDCPDSQLLLDSRYQRWPLEASSCQRLERFLKLLDLV